MKRLVKYLIGLAVLFLIAYNSVYFKKLDEVKAAGSKDFDAKAYARKYFDTKLLPAKNNAVEIDQLMTMLKSDKENTFNKYSHALGIGNIKYFLVKGHGVIIGVNENEVSVKGDSSENSYKIATEFVYGNALRDASGLIDINEFDKTMDFNNVSAELVKIVKTEVLPGFISKIKTGDNIEFFGAIELNKEHLNVNQVEIIPIQINKE